MTFFPAPFNSHVNIIWALLLRELSTRYGRDNIGYLWVIAEPMIFAGGVAVLWSVIRPPYEHGIAIVPFVITGYLPLILIRQTIGFSVTAVKANSELLYHRRVAPLHLFLARFLVEFLGVSLAFVVIVALLNLAGIPLRPRSVTDLQFIYGGWFILAWQSFGLALVMGALAEIFDFVERFVQIITYLMIPVSGAFFMAAWVPAQFRRYLMMIPIIHGFEMIRRGFFGEFIVTYFNVPYAIAWAAGLTLLGLTLVQFVRGRVEVLG